MLSGGVRRLTSAEDGELAADDRCHALASAVNRPLTPARDGSAAARRAMTKTSFSPYYPQTRELELGPAARQVFWGGITISGKH